MRTPAPSVRLLPAPTPPPTVRAVAATPTIDISRRNSPWTRPGPLRAGLDITPPHTPAAARQPANSSMVFADHAALGQAFAPHLVCSRAGCASRMVYTGAVYTSGAHGLLLSFQCGGTAAHTTDVPVPGPARGPYSSLLATGLFVTGASYHQFEVILALLGCPSPVPERAFYRHQGEACAALARVRDTVFDAALASLRDRDVVVSFDFTWSVRREARMGTGVLKHASTGHILSACHVVVGEAGAATTGGRRVLYWTGSSKAMEGLAAERLAAELRVAGVVVVGVVKDDDSTALAAIRRHFPDAAEYLDRNHVVKALAKRVKNAARTNRALQGRDQHLAGHLRRMLLSASLHPDGPSPVLFSTLVHAHLAHLQGDCSICPTAERQQLQPEAYLGGRYHCPQVCACAACAPKRMARQDAVDAARARGGRMRAVLTTMPSEVGRKTRALGP
jgi:hypothetical protein